MATYMNDDLVRRYVRDLCSGALGSHYRSGTLRVTDENELIYHRTQAERRTAWGPVMLCHWNQKNRLFIINGDGFNDTSGTRWQTFLRNEVQRVINAEIRGNTARGSAQGARYLLAPFLALDAAGVNKDTIQIREMQPDGWGNIWHPVAKIPTRPPKVPPSDDLPDGYTIIEDGRYTKIFEVTYGGNRFRLAARQRYSGYGNESPPECTWDGQDMMVWGIDETGNGSWVHIQHWDMFSQQATRRGEEIQIFGGEAVDTQRGWNQRVHHLGAAVFTAREGRRTHVYLSAFDEQETQQRMYYLAQLPDSHNNVDNYRDAIQALAPPIVHKAWADGVNVYRQGDVFAIETTLTDEQVYDGCRSRVRREIALSRTDNFLITRVVMGTATFPLPAEGEVTEFVSCELCGKHRRKSGNGPKAQRALSIYRTGHTADEVVVAKNGATYVRGRMYHDPQIEEPGREREHRTVRLHRDTEERPWMLCVRNTVPRRRIRR